MYPGESLAAQYDGSTPKAKFQAESMNDGKHGGPAISMPRARTMARP
jgi:hypothetical protein